MDDKEVKFLNRIKRLIESQSVSMKHVLKEITDRIDIVKTKTLNHEK